ncbi:hypothetical protein [Methylocella silvestris]|uniref:hypothetical protein n=1 Tax=Methylocella silvestris TaxID=199596 RepID=UPI0002E1E208|nr:hypothetical protein [Methylocella silvestris]
MKDSKGRRKTSEAAIHNRDQKTREARREIIASGRTWRWTNDARIAARKAA